MTPGVAVDLGSGGGLPGLVLAVAWPATRWSLVEGSTRRAGFLEEAVRALALADRVVVDQRRAEEVGRDPAARGSAGLVVARGFGPPAVVAECAAPLLEIGGLVVVSGVPAEGSTDRWPDDEMAPLGLVAERLVRVGGSGYRVLRQASPCPDRYPRRPGLPRRKPLF